MSDSEHRFRGSDSDREPQPVAATVAFVSMVDDTGVGDKSIKRRRQLASFAAITVTGGAPLNVHC